MKKGAVVKVVKKKAFSVIGRRTKTTSPFRLDRSETLPNEAALPQGPGVVSKNLLLKMSAASWLILRNIMYGVSVFGTYELIAYRRFLGSSENDKGGKSSHGSDDSADEQVGREGRAPERRRELAGEDPSPVHRRRGAPPTPIWAHFVAGACAGLVQSTVMDAVEAAPLALVRLRRGGGEVLSPARRLFDFRIAPNRRRFLLRRAAHHSIGYASLFGCFELIRRGLLERLGDSPIPFKAPERRGPRQSANGDSHDVSPVALTAAFLAGGFAGQVHHAVSHYTSHWKFQALTPGEAVAAAGKGGDFESAAAAIAPSRGSQRSLSWSARLSSWKRQMPEPPTLRSVASSFAPTAVAFVAFQYGGELTERMMELD